VREAYCIPRQTAFGPVAYGWTDRPDGKTVSFVGCGTGQIIFGKVPGKRIEFDVRNTTFMSDGVKLVGRLVLPKGSGKIPVVVLVHGAEHDSALDTYALQRLLPARGIGAFVFDKRGTGVSGGTYTQDFNVLAGDAIAAMKEAKRLAGACGGASAIKAAAKAGGLCRWQQTARRWTLRS
jgi:uncharacterized protein